MTSSLELYMNNLGDLPDNEFDLLQAIEDMDWATDAAIIATIVYLQGLKERSNLNEFSAAYI
jgi:hypothetical protein